MTGRRLFIALDISDTARAECTRHIEELRRRHREVRVGWERPEKIHITIKFLGETSIEQLRSIEEGLAGISSRHGRFKLHLAETGVFPSSAAPRILWIGIDDPTDSVPRIYAEVERLAAGTGFRPERRRFRLHATIGRIRKSVSAGDVVKDHLGAQIEPVAFEAANLVIYESKLQPTGSVYSVHLRTALRND